MKKTLIEQKLEQSGKKAELENFLRERLIESGWKDKLQQKCLGKYTPQSYQKLTLQILCAEIIKEKGLEKIELESLVEELLPEGRKLV